MVKKSLLIAIFTAITLSSCFTKTTPDKTIGGAVLGAAWGAGAGAVVGKQIGSTPEGTAIGGGFGLVSGALSGASHDAIEETQAVQEEKLAALKLENLANERQLRAIEDKLDDSVAKGSSTFYTVYFEPDETNLRSGNVAALETIADALKKDLAASMVQVVGHADDTASPEHNERLAEARARTVAAYIAARGVSMDQIKVSSFGSKRPITSNTSSEGRRLNRRVEVFVAR
jgi:outer membrane protein OmpA-like peptidoglycan-associated protein